MRDVKLGKNSRILEDVDCLWTEFGLSPIWGLAGGEGVFACAISGEEGARAEIGGEAPCESPLLCGEELGVVLPFEEGEKVPTTAGRVGW